MALTANQTLYTDVDPNGLEKGQILLEGDPAARFVLASPGTEIPENIAKTFELKGHEHVSKFDADKVRADLVAANEATYADNAKLRGDKPAGVIAQALPADAKPANIPPASNPTTDVTVDIAKTAASGVADATDAPQRGPGRPRAN